MSLVMMRGKSEVTNRTILDLLKTYVNDNHILWEKFLPLVEFAHNNTIHSSTNKTPFEILYTKPPTIPLLRTNYKNFTANEFTLDYKTTMEKVKLAIAKAIQKQKKHVNKHRRYITFTSSSWISIPLLDIACHKTTQRVTIN